MAKNPKQVRADLDAAELALRRATEGTDVEAWAERVRAATLANMGGTFDFRDVRGRGERISGSNVPLETLLMDQSRLLNVLRRGYEK